MPDINIPIPAEGDNVNVPSQEQDPELDKLFSQLEDEYRKFNSNLIVMKNKIEQARVQTLRRALDMLKRSGIDPNDPEQIREFMDKLNQLDPDLLALFEGSMNNLLSGEQSDLSQVPEGQQPTEPIAPEGEPVAPTEQFPNLAQ